MSRFSDDERYDDGPADAELAEDAVRTDDALLDSLGAMDAVSWEFQAAATEPAVQLLAALRADVADLSGVEDVSDETVPLPVVNLDVARRRRERRLGRRALVSGGVALAVLSASGVAAAGIASNPGAPLYPIHKLFLGDEQTASQKAAVKVRRFLALAGRDLDTGRLTPADEALRQARSWLSRVDAGDRGDLPARLAALRARYGAAVDAQGGRTGGNAGAGGSGNSGPGSRGDDQGGSGSGSSGKGSGSSGDDHGGSGKSGEGTSGKSGGDKGSGTGDEHSSGGGDGSGSGSGGEDESDSSGPGSGSSGSAGSADSADSDESEPGSTGHGSGEESRPDDGGDR